MYAIIKHNMDMCVNLLIGQNWTFRYNIRYNNYITSNNWNILIDCYILRIYRFILKLFAVHSIVYLPPFKINFQESGSEKWFHKPYLKDVFHNKERRISQQLNMANIYSGNHKMASISHIYCGNIKIKNILYYSCFQKNPLQNQHVCLKIMMIAF